MNQQVHRLIERVAVRQRLVSLGRWFYVFTLWLAGAYAVLLLVSRFAGAIPNYFTPPTLLLIIALAMVMAMVLHRKPTVNESARAIDQKTGAKDLFLTAAMLESAPGEYKPLVVEAAQKQAGSVKPQAVVPFDFWPKTGRASAALVALLLAAILLPQFDPFGHQAEQKKQAEKKQRLEESIKTAMARTQVLQQQPLDAEQSKEVQAAIDQVKDAFRQMKPQDPAGNLQKLNQQQSEVSKLWQKSAEERLKDSLDKPTNDQQFGSMESEKSKKWQEEMQEGKTDSLQQEAKELEKLAEKMQDEKDPAAKEAQKKEMEKRLSDLSDFVNKQMNKQSLSQALQQAQQQMNDAANPQQSSAIAQAAAKGLQQSMALTQQEMKQVAQAMRDFKSLNQALQAIQSAKAANGSGKPPDGQSSECKACTRLADYMKMYNSMCPGGQCKSDGTPKEDVSMQSMLTPKKFGGGPGSGHRPENFSPNVAFKPEKSETVLSAGKNLLEWKDKGVAESGTANKDYAQSIQDIKQGVSEAILKEEIPPGYHEAIEKYFDSVDKVAATPAGAAPSNK